jgi:non-heme chloroperoxidase
MLQSAASRHSCNRIQMTTDCRAERTRIDLPTLVIRGDRDASAPLELTGRSTAQLIHGAKPCISCTGSA